LEFAKSFSGPAPGGYTGCGRRSGGFEEGGSAMSVIAEPDGSCTERSGATPAEVVLLRWPADGAERMSLAAGHVPRLLLVDDDALPPTGGDCLEDWIRLPAPEFDLQARIDLLRARSRVHRPIRPVIDDHGLVHFGPERVRVAPVEARLAEALISGFGAVVSRDDLVQSVWPDSTPRRNDLDVHVLRLRRRLIPLGLAIRTVRSHGYILEPAGPASAARPAEVG
jgi:Transcriptional regulatory protein, C terminal